MNAVRLESEMKLQAKIIAKKLTSEDSCKEIDTGPHTPTLEQESADIYIYVYIYKMHACPGS